MRLRDRLHWVLRMSLLLFILSSVAFLSALTAMRFAVQGREVAMPNVVGVKAAKAQQMLAQRGIGIRVEDRLYSALPLDAVIRQSPQANMQVKVGQNAHVVLSLGPQKVTIPQLKDKSIRAAQIEMLREGLQLGEVSSAYLPEYPDGYGDRAGSDSRHHARDEPACRPACFAWAAACGIRHAVADRDACRRS